VTGAQDMKFNKAKLEGSRNFATKIWNASRFVLMNLDDYTPGVPVMATPTDRWIFSRLANLAARYDTALSTYEFGEASREIYSFFWSEFCDWYIEFSKARLQEGGEARLATQRNLVFVLDQALRLLHPIMPFVTEEIWGKVPHGDSAPSLMVAAWPDIDALSRYIDEPAEHAIDLVCESITAIRGIRARYGLSPKTELDVVIKASADDVAALNSVLPFVSGLARTASLHIAIDAEKPAGAVAVLAAGLEVFVVLEGFVDFEAEKIRLAKERTVVESNLCKVQKKFDNPGYLAKAAPEVIAKDQAKIDECIAALEILDSQLMGLS
ncbi:MAG: class I tRNA ligase family protein, partial [Actinobacteria bacterium]|nr:class I tRNA ligase family protein [Actinomycetota bacterium]